jgi:hypothetical protein
MKILLHMIQITVWVVCNPLLPILLPAMVLLLQALKEMSSKKSSANSQQKKKKEENINIDLTPRGHQPWARAGQV